MDTCPLNPVVISGATMSGKSGPLRPLPRRGAAQRSPPREKENRRQGK